MCRQDHGREHVKEDCRQKMRTARGVTDFLVTTLSAVLITVLVFVAIKRLRHATQSQKKRKKQPRTMYKNLWSQPRIFRWYLMALMMAALFVYAEFFLFALDRLLYYYVSCSVGQSSIALWFGERLSHFAFLLLRLRVTFVYNEMTGLGYHKAVYYTVFGVATFGFATAVLYYFVQQTESNCEAGASVMLPALIVDMLTTVTVCGMYLSQFYKVSTILAKTTFSLKSSSAMRQTVKLAHIVTKLSVLTMATLMTAALSYALALWIHAGAVAIDTVADVTLVTLMLKHNDEWYRCTCYPCVALCEKPLLDKIKQSVEDKQRPVLLSVSAQTDVDTDSDLKSQLSLQRLVKDQP